MNIKILLENEPMMAPGQDPNAMQDPNAQMDPNMQADPNMMGDPNAQMDPNMAQDPNIEGMDDAAYMNDPNAMGGAPAVPETPALETEKKIRLFTLFTNLLEYVDEYKDTLIDMDITLLGVERLRKLDDLRGNINSIRDKVENYILKIFNNEKYEKNLYMYVLLRTELLTNLKYLRSLLGLEREETVEEFRKRNNIK